MLKRKIRTHLDILSIPRLKNVKMLRLYRRLGLGTVRNLLVSVGFNNCTVLGSSTGFVFPSRALYLRNLVSGYEYGRALLAGVEPGSPSRDAANWLPSRFDLSVETRRQYGWLRMMFSGVRLFRAPIWCPSGGWRHARGREHCRGEPGSSLSGRYAPDSAKAEGSSIVDEPGEG